MGKRSDFERIGKDFYRTIDTNAVKHLLPHLKYGTKFAEVCAGDGILTDQLVATNFLKCTAEYDLYPISDRIQERDALTIVKGDLKGADYIITNPPWSRGK